SKKNPDGVSLRPDMVFSTPSFEIVNGEVKSKDTLAASTVLARVKMLETCKRQLHLRLK
ncbi:hypothetical protein EDC94DRAFT_502645, partial [Helicostylum pulchrum]